MTKNELKVKLEEIYSKYEITEYGKHYVSVEDISINAFVECLDNANLAQHLLDTALCPCEEELEERLEKYNSAEKIIESYEEMMDVLSDLCGFFELKEAEQCQ